MEQKELSLKELRDKINQFLRSEEIENQLRNYLIKCEIEKDISTLKKWGKNEYRYPAVYFQDESENRNYEAILRIDKYLTEKIEEWDRAFPLGVKIVPEHIEITQKGNLQIIAKDILLAGESERAKKLDEWKKEIELLLKEKTEKDPLKFPVKRVKAITSVASTVEADIKENLTTAQVDVKKCQTSDEIAKEIEEANGYDLIVLFRGGHEDIDMDMFSHPKVIRAIFRQKIRVGVALGHEDDRPLVYSYADETYPTPSAFAQEIENRNKLAIQPEKKPEAQKIEKPKEKEKTTNKLPIILIIAIIIIILILLLIKFG